MKKQSGSGYTKTMRDAYEACCKWIKEVGLSMPGSGEDAADYFRLHQQLATDPNMTKSEREIVLIKSNMAHMVIRRYLNAKKFLGTSKESAALELLSHAIQNYRQADLIVRGSQVRRTEESNITRRGIPISRVVRETYKKFRAQNMDKAEARRKTLAALSSEYPNLTARGVADRTRDSGKVGRPKKR